jgi:hypothetical protein
MQADPDSASPESGNHLHLIRVGRLGFNGVKHWWQVSEDFDP